MGGNYWLKLFHEILDDPKMARLSDRLYRRAIELFLLAGDQGENGYLPNLDDAAWRLRIAPEELEVDLSGLETTGIIQRLEDRWHVTNFKKRQAPVPAAERMRQSRKRKRFAQYDDVDYTNSYEPVAKRNTESDREINLESNKSRQHAEMINKISEEVDVVEVDDVIDPIILADMEHFGLNPKLSKELYQKNGADRVQYALEQVSAGISSERIRNPAGFLISLLTPD